MHKDKVHPKGLQDSGQRHLLWAGLGNGPALPSPPTSATLGMPLAQLGEAQGPMGPTTWVLTLENMDCAKAAPGGPDLPREAPNPFLGKHPV